MSSKVSLDSSQLAAAEAAYDARRLITASAGQGKTEVLISRVKNLEEQGLNPADEILLLSFSRAAVDAIRSRSHRAEARNAQILTFDAFAARILLDEGEEPQDGFDQRIRQATKLLREEYTPRIVEPLRHVLIDEAQDLVGDRAEFVLALLDTLSSDAGFTILGDPLQGIYDFQLSESCSKMTSTELFHQLNSHFGAENRILERHYRASTEEMESLIVVADKIRALPANDEGCKEGHSLIDEFIPDQIGTDFLSESGALEPLEGDTTVLLASTNFEILKASEILWKHNVSHVVRRRAQEMSLAPWIFGALGDLPAKQYSFNEIHSKLSRVPAIDPDEAWRHLKLTEGNLSLPEVLDTSRLSRRLNSGSVPLPLTVSDSHRLTLSTVHRAKGLEFSNVIYLPPRPGTPAAEQSWPTLRQKYVAVSRAREQVLRSSFPRDILLLGRSIPSSQRTIELMFRGKGRQTPVRMEFRNDDVDSSLPFSHDEFSSISVMHELNRDSLIGLPLTGILDAPSIEESVVARYILITPEGRPIARTSMDFGYALKTIFEWPGSKNWKWPSTFVGARVTSLETVAGSPSATAAVGLQESGLWLVPRLTGLIQPLWKQD